MGGLRLVRRAGLHSPPAGGQTRGVPPPGPSAPRPKPPVGGGALSLRRIAPAVYGPTLLFGLGQGAVLPVVALSARELGASVATAALVVAFKGIGQLVGDLPAGALTLRIGERRAMFAACALTVAGLVGCVLAPNPAVLGASIFVVGLAAAVWGLARQSYLTEAVPVAMRARALSTLAGAQRIGSFGGPFAGSVVVGWLGTDGGYWMHAVAAVLAAGLLLLLPDVPAPHGTPVGSGQTPTLAAVVRDHLPVLRTLGVAALLVMAVRHSRQTVLPLWCESIGLDAAQTSLVFGLSGAVDMLLFYPAGSVMDRFGRAAVGIPSVLVLGLAHALLPLTSTFGGVVAVGLLMGVGNGMSAGLVMILGADVSPALGRPTFLGAWRVVADLGNAAGPVAVGAVAAAASLGVASVAVGGLGVLAALCLWAWTPRRVAGAEGTTDVSKQDGRTGA